MTDTPVLRVVRSFVRREGRITEAQRAAMADLYPQYGVPPGAEPLDLAELFGRVAPLHLEIGFGMGDALLHMAEQHPEHNYLGIEVHRPGVGALLRRVHAQGITNVRVICADAVTVLRERLPDATLAAAYVLFPDPWQKKRHHKRRLISPEFTALLRQKLIDGGLLHLATDWEDYAQHMLSVLETTPGLRHAAAQLAARPPTKFEQRGVRLGHVIVNLCYAREEYT